MFPMYSSCTAPCPAADEKKAIIRTESEKEIQQTDIIGVSQLQGLKSSTEIGII